MLEVFGPTVQGEGPIAGRPCHFIRLAICDSRCVWCDTKESWTAKQATRKTFGEIAEEVAGLGLVDIITITGGNPCVHPLVDLLMAAIWRVMPNVQFSLETQGTIWQEWVRAIKWCVVSPKPPSSTMEVKWDQLLRFMEEAPNPYLKIVVFDEADYQFAKLVHLRYPNVPFYLSVGSPVPFDQTEVNTRLRWLFERVANDSDMRAATVLPQLHKFAWSDEKGR